MEFSNEQKQIIDAIINTNDNMLVLGVAGAGKSAVINEVCRQVPRGIAILGTTGIAAVNVGGHTIHSYLKIGIHNELRNLDFMAEAGLRRIKKIIIDEGSMLRPDLLDAFNLRLQKVHCNIAPFGGVQIIIIGDLYQLPPIVHNSDTKFFKKYETPFFFSSKNYQKGNFKFFELTKVFRQDNKDFIDILSRIRLGTTTDADIDKLNERWIENLDHIDEGVILISTVNKIADLKNQMELKKLQSEEKTFYGMVHGKYPKSLYPVDDEITLKVGARVMTTVNKNEYRNGSLGVITSFGFDGVYIKLDSGIDICVNSHTFELREQGDVIGEYEQIPLKLAWAISIHKSQGQTFKKVIIDIGTGTFVGGQFYVAISRGERLEDIYFIQKIEKKHIYTNHYAEKFLNSKK